MYVMGMPIMWEDFLHLVDFSYNKSYQTTIKMSPFKAFYGKKFHTQITWSQRKDRLILGLEVL